MPVWGNMEFGEHMPTKTDRKFELGNPALQPMPGKLHSQRPKRPTLCHTPITDLSHQHDVLSGFAARHLTVNPA